MLVRLCVSDLCLSDVCLSRTSGLSREQRGLGRLKLAEVAQITRDSDTTFKVKRSKVNLQGAGHIVAASRTACYAPPLIGVGIKRCFCLTSVVYIRPKSRTERTRKTKVGTEVAHVTCDSDTSFKVKRSKVKVTSPLNICCLRTIRDVDFTNFMKCT